MKTIYLIRHAKSSWKNYPGIEDFDRPLNERGEKEAVWTAKRLKQSGAHPEILISSPAVRARSTAQVIAKHIKYPPKKIIFEPAIYESGLREIVNIIKNIDEKYSRAAIFGHNPSMSSVLNYLSSRELGEMPTAAMACLEFEVDTWQKMARKKGKVVFFESPDHLKEKTES